jgi:hypothetical protein
MDDELQKAADAVKEAQQALTESSGAGAEALWSEHFVFSLSIGLFLFAIIIFACATYLLHKGTKAWTLLRLFGVLSIIFLTVFVLIVGYSDRQLLPVIGLFGSIVGYLLGKTTAGDQAQPDTEPPNSETSRKRSGHNLWPPTARNRCSSTSAST